MAQVDREALCAIFRATNGPDSWLNTEGWNTNADLGLWFGVQVDAESRVVWLHLIRKNRHEDAGPIPDELGKLTALQHLNLSSNELTGPIPDELGKLTALQHLDLSHNKLTGPIPDELGKLTALQALDLSWNELTGPIPDELGKLTALQALDLSWNKLTGTIPDGLGKLPAVRYVDLSGNRLTEASQGKQKKPSIDEMKRIAERFEATESSLDEAKIRGQPSDVSMSDDTQKRKEAEGMINNPEYHEESSRAEVVNDEEIVLTNCLGTQAAKFSHPAYGIDLILEDKSLEHEIKKQVVVKPEIKIVECGQDRDFSRTHEELLALSSEDVTGENTSTFMVMPIVYGPSEATFHEHRPAKLRFFAGYLGDLQNELLEEGDGHYSKEDVKRHLRGVYEPLTSADGHNWRMLPPVDVIFESSENEATQVWLETRLYHFSMGSIAKLLPKLKKSKYEAYEAYEGHLPLRKLRRNWEHAMLGNATEEDLVYYACKDYDVTEQHQMAEGGAAAAVFQASAARGSQTTIQHHGLNRVGEHEVPAGKYKSVKMFMDGSVVQKQMVIGVFLTQPKNLVYLGKTTLKIRMIYAALPEMIEKLKRRRSKQIPDLELDHNASTDYILDFIRSNK